MDKIALLQHAFDVHCYLCDVSYHNFACRTCYEILSADLADLYFDHNQFYLEF